VEIVVLCIIMSVCIAIERSDLQVSGGGVSVGSFQVSYSKMSICVFHGHCIELFLVWVGDVKQYIVSHHFSIIDFAVISFHI